MRFFIFLITLISLSACAQQSSEIPAAKTSSNITTTNADTAYFAAGCFWCVEAIFESIEGVEKVISGYTGGIMKNPTYEAVCTGRTGHAETVMIIYDKTKVPYDTLLSAFFNSHNPSTLNSQGPDFGTQYRSAIYYTNKFEEERTEIFIDSLLRKKIFTKITTEVKPLDVFWEAEIYHQDYEKNNPDNPYVQRISVPRFNRFKQKFSGKLKTESTH
jgi:peptide-methionine (S)-S-oxide reductase